MKKHFYIGYGTGGERRKTSLIDTLFNVQGSDTATEESDSVGTLSSDWDFSAGRVKYEDIDNGFSKEYTHEEFAKGVVVERKLIDDNKTRIGFGRSRQLGDSAFRKREKDAASVFNSAFSGVLGPDGKTLCANDHPQSAENSSTWDNQGSLSLSESGLSTTRVAMSDFTDDQDDIMDVVGDQILYPPELEDTALKATNSDKEPDTANNAVNPQTGRYQRTCWHYLTDPNNWFMFDSSRRAEFLNWFDRISLEFGAEEDFDTLERKYRAYMRYSFGWDDAHFVFGNQVS